MLTSERIIYTYTYTWIIKDTLINIYNSQVTSRGNRRADGQTQTGRRRQTDGKRRTYRRGEMGDP